MFIIKQIPGFAPERFCLDHHISWFAPKSLVFSQISWIAPSFHVLLKFLLVCSKFSRFAENYIVSSKITFFASKRHGSNQHLMATSKILDFFPNIMDIYRSEFAWFAPNSLGLLQILLIFSKLISFAKIT